MIAYEKLPIGPADASKLKAWLASPEANLFRECAVAKMNAYYFDSINTKCKHTETMLDRSKLEARAVVHENKGSELQYFIEIFEQLSSPEHGFFKLKINT